MHPRNNRYVLRSLTTGVLAATVLAATSSPRAQSASEGDISAVVMEALEGLSGYGVFDALGFYLEHGAVTIHGYAYAPGLGQAAAAAVGRMSGVDEVANAVEQLPVSPADDRIRWITFYQIYTDDVLSRYAPGGASGARFDLFQFGGVAGTQPGGYPIHIVVKHGQTILAGAVSSAVDGQLAELRARDVSGVYSVENQLVPRR